MLVLSRKVGEKIHISDNIILVVTKITGNRVQVGIEAPPEIRVTRGELINAAPTLEHTPTDFPLPNTA